MLRHKNIRILGLLAILTSCNYTNTSFPIEPQPAETKSTSEDTTTHTTGITFELETEEMEEIPQDVNL